MSDSIALRISPTPSDDKAAAIMAALRAHRQKRVDTSGREPSNWVLAARRMTHQAADGWLPRSWRRAARIGA